MKLMNKFKRLLHIKHIQRCKTQSIRWMQEYEYKSVSSDIIDFELLMAIREYELAEPNPTFTLIAHLNNIPIYVFEYMLVELPADKIIFCFNELVGISNKSDILGGVLVKNSRYLNILLNHMQYYTYNSQKYIYTKLFKSKSKAIIKFCNILIKRPNTIFEYLTKSNRYGIKYLAYNHPTINTLLEVYIDNQLNPCVDDVSGVEYRVESTMVLNNLYYNICDLYSCDKHSLYQDQLIIAYRFFIEYIIRKCKILMNDRITLIGNDTLYSYILENHRDSCYLIAAKLCNKYKNIKSTDSYDI